ncbi:MAG: hypothetical protein NVV68_07455 [Dokdonella sp.]|nr:hypothetical protein [Dokdonella sp.]
MSDISHASQEPRICPVCTFSFEASASRYGHLCDFDEDWLRQNDHVVLIECDRERSGLPELENAWAHVDNPHRTGRIDFLPRTWVARMAEVRLPADQVSMFVSREMMDWVRVMRP